jgi:hypothetical protein
MITRKFGVEIEFVGKSGISRAAIAEALTNAGVPTVAERCNHHTRNYWKIITDASCGYELVSPPLTDESGLEQIKTACQVLKAMGAKVNDKCGLHVHIDANGLKVKQIKSVILNFIQNESVFDLLVNKSRRLNNSNFCRGLQDIDIDRLGGSRTVAGICGGCFDNNRYFKMNIGSYLRHGTLEFRQMHGTLDATEICNWVLLLQSFFARAIDGAIAGIRASLIERFNALMPGTPSAEVAPTAPSKMKDIKVAVYRLLGLTTSKEIKAWAVARGMAVNLRTKASWAAIYSALASTSAPSGQGGLNEYFIRRTIDLGTNALLHV